MSFCSESRNVDERRFYEIEATSQNWNVGELKRQYNSSLYERLALSRDKAGIRKLATEGQTIAKPEDLLKEPLVLEFLGLETHHRYSESDLETAIINQIERFLLKLGKGFLFESRQQHFTFDGDDYFVDLVFYNRLLQYSSHRSENRQAHAPGSWADANVRQLFRPSRDNAGRIAHNWHPPLQTEQQGDGQDDTPKGANIHAREYQLYLPGKAELQRKLIRVGRKK